MVARKPNETQAKGRTAWSALWKELRDEPVYVAAYKFAKEVLGETIRQIPVLGPLIMGGLAAAELLAGEFAEPDPRAAATVEALVATHRRELDFREEQLAVKDAQIRPAGVQPAPGRPTRRSRSPPPRPTWSWATRPAPAPSTPRSGKARRPAAEPPTARPPRPPVTSQPSTP